MKTKSNRRGRRQRGYRGLLWVLAAGLLLFGLIAQQNILLGTSSRHALLMDARTGQVLARKRSGEEAAPASLTKMMTVLLAAEALPDLDTPVTLPEDIFPALYKADASMAGFQPGEMVTVRDLLYGAMLPSGAECCEALARQVSGSEEAFVAQMNEKAQQLGMNDTVFKNCNGLDEEGHVTSAYDVALMSRELIRHEKVFDYTLTWMDSVRGGETQLVNTNKLIRSYQGITGLKTGTTGQAGSCITATAERNGLSLIAVVLGADSTDHRFQDAAALLDYGFAGWKATVPEAPALEPVPVARGMAPTVEAQVGESPSLLLEAAETGSVETEVLLEELTAPVKAGDVIGTVRYSLGGEVLAEVDITAAGDVEAVTFASALGHLFRGLFAL